MKIHKKLKVACMLAFSLISFNCLSAFEEGHEESAVPRDAIAGTNPAYIGFPEEKTTVRKVPVTPLPITNPEEEYGGAYFSTNAGIGLLYNRRQTITNSPVYEAVAGYHLGTRMKIAASYQYQRSIDMIELPLVQNERGHLVSSRYGYLSGYEMDMQVAALKFFAAPGMSARWGKAAFYPYLSAGIGYGWLNLKEEGIYRTPVVTADVGMAVGTTLISATAGCKFNGWSVQSRLYSLIPYIGLQLTF